jgi:hypothetical protein
MTCPQSVFGVSRFVLLVGSAGCVFGAVSLVGSGGLRIFVGFVELVFLLFEELEEKLLCLVVLVVLQGLA